MAIKKEYITSDGERFTIKAEAERHEALWNLAIDAVDYTGSPVDTVAEYDRVAYIRFKTAKELQTFIESVLNRGCMINTTGWKGAGIYEMTEDGDLAKIPTVEEIANIYSFFDKKH